jgi:hypothetical protein
MDTTREKAMLVMSDGQANNCYLDVLGSDGSWDCPDSEAELEAIRYACMAKKNYNINIYSVAFGNDADIPTLQGIADCDNSSNFYYSNNVTGLQEIYKTIAEDMLKEMVIAETQNFDIVGNFTDAILYGDSYIRLKDNDEVVPYYGKITFTDIVKIDPVNPNITIPENAQVIDAKVTSYSMNHWTSLVKVNGVVVYNISDYKVNFTDLGDPYVIDIPVGLISTNNEIIVESTDISQNMTYLSKNNSFIYTMAIDATTGYTQVLDKNVGCTWEIDFEDGNGATISVPSSYSGSKSCHYTNSSIDYDSEDTIDLAVFSLLDKLDPDSDGRIIVNIVESDFEIYLMSVPKVPYMWGPTVIKVNAWNKNN